ncbi:hypothetical protein GNP86_02950 [Aliivibrio fischeri]|nr:hypothetical protein [Aliivibrio fischeri]
MLNNHLRDEQIHSLSTGASELGVMSHVVEKMLGHELGGVLSVCLMSVMR